MANIIVPDAAVAVLTGGQSSRMGFPKAELKDSSGRRFFEALAGHLSFFPCRYLSLAPDQHYEYPGFTPLRDEYPGTGPMGAILTALSHAEKYPLFVIACDMPAFTGEEAGRIFADYRGEDALIPAVNGRWQPLAALYSRRMIPVFRECLEKEEFRLRNAIMKSAYRLCEVPEELRFNYLNLNTPEEFQEYQVSCGHLGDNARLPEERDKPAV